MRADPQPLTAEELAAIRADLALASPLDRECEELRAIAGLLATVEALQAQVAELEAGIEAACDFAPSFRVVIDRALQGQAQREEG